MERELTGADATSALESAFGDLLQRRRLTCAHGSPIGPKGCGPCEKCQAETAKLSAQHKAAVARGDNLPSGHTPEEWAASSPLFPLEFEDP